MTPWYITTLRANGGEVHLNNSLILWRDCVVTGNTTIIVDKSSRIILTDFHYWNNTHRSLNHNIYGGSTIINHGTFIADPTSGDVVFDGEVVNYGNFTLSSNQFRCLYASNWATSKFINHGIFNNSAACTAYMQMFNEDDGTIVANYTCGFYGMGLFSTIYIQDEIMSYVERLSLPTKTQPCKRQLRGLIPLTLSFTLT
jgi:hypothetical protein